MTPAARKRLPLCGLPILSGYAKEMIHEVLWLEINRQSVSCTLRPSPLLVLLRRATAQDGEIHDAASNLHAYRDYFVVQHKYLRTKIDSTN